MSADNRPRRAKFPVTDWSLVGRVGQTDPECKREALEVLLIRYLPALEAHLVHRKRLSQDEAQDLLQEFITSKIIERDLIGRARHDVGKFRTFLLTALDRFLINRVRDEHAKKRSPEGGKVVALGERVDQLEAEAGPATAFHVAWAHNVISDALARMRVECEVSGRPDLWGVFESRIVGPTLQGDRPIEYGELIERFGFRSPMQASNALITAKRMYARTLRAVIAEYTQDEEEIESEIDELREILARCGP